MTTQACSSNRKLKFESPVFFYICSVTEELTEVQYYPPPTEYNVPDLVRHWINGEPSFEYEYEWLDYHTSLSCIENEYFHSLATDNLNDSVKRVNYLVSIHANTTLLATATIERLLHYHHRSGNDSESFRYKALIEYSKSFLKPHSPQRSLPRLKWTGKFSDFVELLDALFLTGKLKGLKIVDLHELIHELVEFEEPKTAKIFEVTMYKNRLRINKTRFIEELLNDYGKLLKKKLEGMA